MFFTKFKTTGVGIWYMVAFFIIRVIALAVFIIDVIIPIGGEFLNLLEGYLNNGGWDLLTLLTPIGWILLYFVLLEASVAFFVFVILYPMVKRRLQRGY